MSAKLDKSQGFQFYYGNAMVELKDFLPQEEKALPNSNSDSHHETKLAVIESLVNQSLAHMNSLQDSRRQLRFLLSDIKRMIG
jgi:hypothetical protein